MNKLKITTGEWVPVNYGGYYEIQNTGKYNGDDLLDSSLTPRAEANISLCCDAGNTYQQCGLLPSELLEALKSTRKYLNHTSACIWDDEGECTCGWDKIIELFELIEKQENETK